MNYNEECKLYEAATSTSLRCVHCGRLKYEHYNYNLKKY